MATVLIPLHSSALSTLDSSEESRWLIVHAACLDSNGNLKDLEDDSLNVKALALQSHSEGAFWHGLFPLLSADHHSIGENSGDGVEGLQSMLALSVLVEHFKQSILLLWLDLCGQDEIQKHHRFDLESDLQSGKQEYNRNRKDKVVAHCILGSWLAISIPFNHQQYTTDSPSPASNDNREPISIVLRAVDGTRLTVSIPPNFTQSTNNNTLNTLLVIILPPNPYRLSVTYSRFPSTHPTSHASTLIISHENNLIRLQSVSAYISTLGGGYFLCRHLSTAIVLARKQGALAAMRGDQDMIWRCRINEGYCYLYGGYWKRGRKVVNGVLREVLEKLREKYGESAVLLDDFIDLEKTEACNLTIVRNMCLSALWFADKIREARLNEEGAHSTHDDFQRIRVVNDRRAGQKSVSFKEPENSSRNESIEESAPTPAKSVTFSSFTVTYTTDSGTDDAYNQIPNTDASNTGLVVDDSPKLKAVGIEDDLSINSNLNLTNATVESELTSVPTDTLMKLMKEQVELVRDLTNAQAADRKELEELKREKERLEREGREKDKCAELMREQLNVVRDLTNVQIANQKELEEVRREKERLERDAQEREAAVAKATAAAVAAAIGAGAAVATQQQNIPQTAPEDSSESTSTLNLLERIIRDMRGPRPPPGSKNHPDAEYYAKNSVNSTDQENVGSSVNITGPQTGQGYKNKDKIEITSIPERNVVPPKKTTCIGVLWLLFCYIVTLFIPNFLLFCIGRKETESNKSEAKQAWREKIGLCVIMLVFCSGFIGISGVIPVLLCSATTKLSIGPPEMLCEALNYAMYTIMILIAAVLAVQCICSLIYLFRCKRTISRDDTRSKIIVMVPCYNEGDKELRKTIDSVMDSSYPDDNKVLLVICDGNITGKGERRSTPETLSRLLGYSVSESDRSFKCTSIGALTDNEAKIYYGRYRDCGREMNYIVIVKTGIPGEKGNSRAGNRGKRDSQLLFTGLLNRFHHGRELNDLDNAIKNALDHLQVPLDEVKYLMAIDADTRIDRESISHMAYSMNKNDRILALCGETKVENKAQSWVTMIQVFEYYINHHMKKAFESVFGCVTCLPGCFTMYRLYNDDGLSLLACDDVYQRYAINEVKTLHDKNLFHLGEDRFLTTLLLCYFPDMKLSFVPEAYCYTIVPHTFSILLSQRRRWINSTFHNMLELVRVNTMCGFCCFSMKTIVVLDLIGTLILPASLIYVGYILYLTVWVGQPLSLLMLIVWGIVLGVQVVVFLLRSRWDYWWWFFVFLLFGVPIFYFVLPLYSFWHMDDFSWGQTRQVSNQVTAESKKKSDA